jgi:hypothetical protein
MTPKSSLKKSVATNATKVADTPKTGLVLTMRNYKMMLAGFAVIVVGFVLMSGGKSPSPDVFNGDVLYGFRRITLATIVVLLGFFFEFYAIMSRPKPKTI